MKIFISIILLLLITVNVSSQVNYKKSIVLSGGLSHYRSKSSNSTNGPNRNISLSLTKYKNKRWGYSTGISYLSSRFEYKESIATLFNELKYVQIPLEFKRRFFFYSNHNLNVAAGVHISRLFEWCQGEVINDTQTDINYLDNAEHTALGVRLSPGYSYQISKRIKLHAIGSINYKIGKSSIISTSDNVLSINSLNDQLSLSLNIGIEVLL